jgi:hypothetical protein
MMFSKIIVALLLAIITAVVGSPLAADKPPIGGLNTTDEAPAGTFHISPEGIRYLVLRDDFPQDHPALNVTLLVELMSENKSLPQLPGIDGMSFAPEIPPKGNRWCQTTAGSPHWLDVWKMHSNLAVLAKKPGGQLCCATQFPSKCSAIMAWKTAKSDICRWDGKQVGDLLATLGTLANR